MPRLNYALPTDVVRRFNPQITHENLANWESDPTASMIGNEDLEVVTSRLEGVESKWDRNATPMRPVRVGSRDAPIYKSAKGRGFPVHVYLDHRNIHPIDPDRDVIERRTGRDSWTDITRREGSSWTADYRKGKLTVYTLPGRGNLPALRNYRDRFIRISYRLGAGGDYSNAGQTTLEGELTADQTGSVTVSVADASRLPRTGDTMLVGGSEYVQVSDVDHTTDEITISNRGLRLSPEEAHSAGETIHFCPMDVREAVAAKAARELVLFDDWADELVESGDAPRPEAKLDNWDAEWNDAVSDYGSLGGYR